MQLPQWLARFNRYVTNPIQRLWAGWLPAFAILEHVGRRSGKPYRTPLNVFSADVDGRAGVAILLTYGPNRDWLKNITAAGGGRMRRYGKTFGVANPRRLTKAEAAPYVSSRWRPVFARLPFDEAVLLTKAEAAPYVSSRWRPVFARLPFDEAVLLTKAD
ncbi:deazaflavin-dependent nitroreductase [Mycobacterium tuberculosis]|uniref:nitroreductase family deazaflavin-dependent oxidoreductase n=1 Tax=Mycobacterium tuberculosis TaxID=1773 RepID=UPI0005E2F4EF|nr:deazaflavin-dependent nitroreductase [Mycobacterium tuberculosis]CLT94960.1 deazaflavin-dependent nitroreductase [Mycobacterium tuberculosis]CLZ98251.1 deazaflavin-dependent nitroreductase [Mycobacterium tuberculosis]